MRAAGLSGHEGGVDGAGTTSGHPAQRGVVVDISRLLGPVKWTWFYLSVITDIYRRSVPGWPLARGEQPQLAERLLADSIAKQAVDHGQLTIHADPWCLDGLQAGGVPARRPGRDQRHSRPHCSNDDPTQRPGSRPQVSAELPDRFGCHEDPSSFCRRFFCWYDDQPTGEAVSTTNP
jgi:putative transposase